MQRRVARWLVDCDPDATRRCYSQVSVGTGCTCNQCRNFDAVAKQAFPPEFVSLLDALGVEPTKPAELCHYCREPSGLFLTGGWFHFVGKIIEGDDVVQYAEGTGTYQFEKLSNLEYGFSNHLALVRNVFMGFPLVQVEFLTHIPWVLPEPEPLM